MSGKLAVVIGITGNQGGSVARAFLDGGYKVRGVTRDPSKPSSQKWVEKGAEVVAGDLNDEASLTKAFKGANVIFTNSDFWQIVGGPSVKDKASEQGRQVNEIAFDIELQQQKNMIHAAAATLDTLDRFIQSTLAPAKKLSKGKYTHLYHFDSKADASEYIRRTHPELAQKTSYISMPYYITNWKSGLMQPKKQEDGTYVLSAPISPNRKIPFGLPDKVAGPFAKALAETEPGKNLQVSAGMMTFPEWTEKIGKKIGKTVKFQEIDGTAWDQAVPVLGQELREMMQFYSDFGYDGGDPTVIYPDQLGVDVKYQTVDEYVDSEDWSPLLNQ